LLLRAVVIALALLLLWMVVAAGTAGIGLAVRRRVAAGRLTGTSLALGFWLGLALLILFLQTWHLFAPIGPATLAIVVAAGLVGLIRHAAAIAEWIRSADRRRAWPIAGGLLLLGAWAAHRGTLMAANFDTYMYHIPVVEWYRAHPLVPGFGNLHGRFAFNNANFLLAALIETVRADSTHVVNGVVLMGFLFHVTVRVAGWARGAIPSAPALFDLVLLAPALAMVNDAPMWAGLTPGVPANLAMFAAFSILFAAAYRVPEDSSTRATAIVVATALLATAAAIKLNVAATAVGAWIVGIAALWRLTRQDVAIPRGLVVAALALAAGIGGGWLVRGAIASGYPLYPNTAFALPVDWKVPLEQARAEFDWIRLFGRYFDAPAAYNGHAWIEFACTPFAWFGPWLSSVFDTVRLWQLPVPLFLALTFALFAGTRRRGLTTAWWLALPLAIGLAVWWRIAPRPVFGSWMFWLAAALIVAQTAGDVALGRRLAIVAAAGIGLVAALPLIGAGREAARRSADSNLAAVASVVFVKPPAYWGVQPTRWHFPQTAYTTRSGLTLRVPEGHRCGRSALPCTSHPAPNLELRRDGDLRSGFRVSGTVWRAERWPNPWSAFLADWRSVPACRGPSGQGLDLSRSVNTLVLRASTFKCGRSS
jgi:hypothetical protein